MDTAFDYILDKLIENEVDDHTKSVLKMVQDLYQTRGYLPSGNDWYDMTDEERQQMFDDEMLAYQ